MRGSWRLQVRCARCVCACVYARHYNNHLNIASTHEGANAKLARPIWVFHKVKDEGQGEGLGGEKQSEAVKQGAGNDESGDNAADWVRCRNKRLEAQTLMVIYTGTGTLTHTHSNSLKLTHTQLTLTQLH